MLDLEKLQEKFDNLFETENEDSFNLWLEEKRLSEIERECRQDAEKLLMCAAAFDTRRSDKPGDFFNRVKSMLSHPEKLKAHHFPRFRH